MLYLLIFAVMESTLIFLEELVAVLRQRFDSEKKTKKFQPSGTIFEKNDRLVMIT